MNSTIILVITVILLIYTLYYTYSNDFGMFLFIVLILLVGIFLSEYIHEKITNIEEKINLIKDVITQRISNVRNYLGSELKL
jgi:ABC-type multidrug transport system fused ATPase/permease subunit